MSEQKRRGWLSRLLGGGDTSDATAVPPPPAALPPGQALDLLFGPAGRAAAALHEVDSARSDTDGAPLRKAPPPGTPAYVPPSNAVPARALPAPAAAPGPPAPGAALPPTTAAALPPAVAIDSTPPVDLSSLAAAAAAALSVQLRIIVHVANRGDMEVGLDSWAGERGSGLQVEGLAVTPIEGLDPDDLEYRALLHDGTLTDWCRDAALCGSRGDFRPLLGFAFRLAGYAAARHSVSYAAVFVDGAEVGPVADGTLCAAPSGAGLEAIYVMIDPIEPQS